MKIILLNLLFGLILVISGCSSDKKEYQLENIFPSMKHYECIDIDDAGNRDTLFGISFNHLYSDIDTFQAGDRHHKIVYSGDKSLLVVKQEIDNELQVYKSTCNGECFLLKDSSIQSDYDFFKFIFSEGNGKGYKNREELLALKELYVTAGYKNGFYEIEGCGFKGFQTGGENGSSVIIKLYGVKVAYDVILMGGVKSEQLASFIQSIRFVEPSPAVGSL